MTLVNAGLALLHIATGSFFTITGGRKCFKPEVRSKVCELFDRYNVPKPAQYAVMGGELAGGLGLISGTLTHIAALGLLVIMLGAYVLDTWPAVKAKHPQPLVFDSKLLSNALCTPEAQLIVITATLALTGAGSFGVDAWLFG